MTIYTDRYRVPMPEDSDPIYQGASQMRDLARKVDTVLSDVSDASALDATSSATPGRIVQRDNAGRAQVANPSSAGDIATLNTVTSQVGVVAAKLGGLSFQVRTTPPPAGTANTVITFVRP